MVRTRSLKVLSGGASDVTVETDGAHELAERLAARYWDADDPSRVDDLAEILGADQVRLVIQPDEVRRFVY